VIQQRRGAPLLRLRLPEILSSSDISLIKEEADEGENAIGVTKKITGGAQRFHGDMHMQHDYAGDSTDKQHGNSTI
jgi:hypothetical protein